MLKTVEWGEFRLDKLFIKLKCNKLKYKVNDLPGEPTNIFTLPALTAGIQNQGLNSFVPRKDATILKNAISISANGANTGATFYQSKEFTILQDAYALKWIYTNHQLTDRQFLYITACISSRIYGNYEWTRKAGWERIRNENIYLPLKNSQIDFDFMENFIYKLEQQRLDKIEAYLSAAGLKDYTLTIEEEQALASFTQQQWKKFSIGDLFKKIETNKLPYKAKNLPKEPTGKYILPSLTSSFMNQGLNYYVPKEEATVLKDVISIPSNSDVYRAYFQSIEFTVLSDAYAINWKNEGEKLTSNEYLFMVSSINKVIDLSIYSYKNKLGGWNVVKNKIITLPINKVEEINFEYMKTLIRAIKKQTIKEVIHYVDEKIAVTKKVIVEEDN